MHNGRERTVHSWKTLKNDCECRRQSTRDSSENKACENTFCLLDENLMSSVFRKSQLNLQYSEHLVSSVSTKSKNCENYHIIETINSEHAVWNYAGYSDFPATGVANTINNGYGPFRCSSSRRLAFLVWITGTPNGTEGSLKSLVPPVLLPHPLQLSGKVHSSLQSLGSLKFWSYLLISQEK